MAEIRWMWLVLTIYRKYQQESSYESQKTHPMLFQGIQQKYKQEDNSFTAYSNEIHFKITF